MRFLIIVASILFISSCGSSGAPQVPATAVVVSTPTVTMPIVTVEPPQVSKIELDDWNISIPTDVDGSSTADTITELMLIGGYENEDYFYLNDDGSIVFKCPIEGYKTSQNTSYTRSELRGMLRRGDSDLSNVRGVNKNNWVFSSAPQADLDAAGGVDGVLTADVAVNYVTTTGSSSQVGRVIIGQIHANDDEPVRLYYRKLPQNTKGSIYFAHEPLGEDDDYYEMIGTRSRSASDPADGIALDERFSYRIEVEGNTLTVTISREGKDDITQQADMSGSGYDQGGQFMYFKAGVYNQNNSGDADDYVQATFYSIRNSHNGYGHNE